MPRFHQCTEYSPSESDEETNTARTARGTKGKRLVRRKRHQRAHGSKRQAVQIGNAVNYSLLLLE